MIWPPVHGVTLALVTFSVTEIWIHPALEVFFQAPPIHKCLGLHQQVPLPVKKSKSCDWESSSQSSCSALYPPRPSPHIWVVKYCFTFPSWLCGYPSETDPWIPLLSTSLSLPYTPDTNPWGAMGLSFLTLPKSLLDTCIRSGLLKCFITSLAAGGCTHVELHQAFLVQYRWLTKHSWKAAARNWMPSICSFHTHQALYQYFKSDKYVWNPSPLLLCLVICWDPLLVCSKLRVRAKCCPLGHLALDGILLSFHIKVVDTERTHSSVYFLADGGRCLQALCLSSSIGVVQHGAWQKVKKMQLPSVE